MYISGIYLCPLRTREASRRIARLHWKPQIRCIDSGRGMLDVLYVQRDWFVQHRTEAAYRRAMKPTCQERTHTLHRHRTECTHTPWLLLHQGQGVQYLPGRAPHRHLPPPPIHERTKRESMTLPPEWTKGEAPPPTYSSRWALIMGAEGSCRCAIPGRFVSSHLCEIELKSPVLTPFQSRRQSQLTDNALRRGSSKSSLGV